MSKEYSYIEFCNHHDIEIGSAGSLIDYRQYRTNLEIMNRAFSERAVNEALNFAKVRSKTMKFSMPNSPPKTL